MPLDDETKAARAAQATWAALSLKDRLQPIARLRTLLAERRHDLTAAMLADVERPPAETLATDVMPSASACKYLLTDAKRILKPRVAGRTPLWLMGSGDVVMRRPHGVVGIIGTWNYPLFLNLVPIVHALTAGNAVLWKPSENSVKLAKVLTDLFRDAAYPAGLIQTLPATREGGPQLADADIDFIHFTGSEAVGRKLAARLGERLIPSVLELSGVDACIVMPDADLSLAARSAWYGLTLNKGQTCLAVRRIFVHIDVAEKFCNELRKHAAKSSPMRVLKSGQIEQAQRLVSEAAGHKVIAAPGTPGESEFNPTVILNASPKLGVFNEAIFAPLAAMTTFRTVDELVLFHNACGFGLGCSIFSECDRDFVPRLKVGVVTGNDLIAGTAHPATPLAGRGRAGWGPTQGDEGLLAMTVPQVISVRRGSFRPHIDAGLNPHPGDEGLLEGMLRFTHGQGLRERMRGFVQMIRGIMATRKRGQ